MGVWNIVSAAFDTPRRDGGWGLPLVLTGLPGTAKTSKAKDLARQKGAACEVLIPSLMESTDFGGHPYLNERTVFNADGKPAGKEKELALAAPAWAKRAARSGRCLVVIDEGNAANQTTFAALMRTVLDNQCGDFDLGGGTRWLFLMNPVDVSAAIGGQEIPPALANRFGHLDAGMPDFNEWVEWISLGEDPNAERAAVAVPEEREREILDVWADAFEKASTEVVTFLTAKPDRRMGMPNPGPALHGPWPSPRSWEMAIRARASARVHGLGAEDALRFQAAFVGHEAVREFHEFIRRQDLPDPKEWLAGKVTFEASDERPDRTQSFLVACGLTLAQMPKGKRSKELTRLLSFAKGLDGRRDAAARSFFTFVSTLDHSEIMGLDRSLEAYFNDVASVAGKADSRNARRGV